MAMDKKKIIKISSIILGVILSILVVVVGFNLLQNVFTRASDIEPRDVLVSDKTENSAKITWTTGQEAEGVVQYGVSPTSLTSFGQPEEQRSTSHSVTLTLLSPNTTYYFQITSGGKTYDNGGVPWTFTTLDKKSGTVPSLSVSPVVSPSPVSTTPRPSPAQTLQVPTTPSPTSAGCAEASGTDCAAIKTKLGKGCNTQDYFKCLNRTTPTP